MTWRRMDLHIHTLASACYKQPNTTYLQILQKADERGLDIIALTDHNTAAGIAAIRTRIQELELLERLQRLHGDEKRELDEYRRLGDKILILPGFEFTATLGFHILGIFPPATLVRELEHILLNLRVPAEKLDLGSGEVGATADVLTAYKIISDAGGLVIAAHANSTHGVAMRGFDFGGQTKIAYTQDPNLHALEVTDLEQTGRRTTAAFFNGSKPEYPRRMHCIQASDSHCIEADPTDKDACGVGDRMTEILLPEVSFEALKEVLQGTDFTRTRPYRHAESAFDFVQAAQESGPSIVQSFFAGMGRKGGHMNAILRDVVAFANTNGGTIFMGVAAKPQSKPGGIERPEEAARTLTAEIDNAVVPPIDVDIDVLKTQGKSVLRLTVPKGDSPPYSLNGLDIYVRQEAETSRAMRDEIVQLIRRAVIAAPVPSSPAARDASGAKPHPVAAEARAATSEVLTEAGEEQAVAAPRTGVEVVEVVERKGTQYYTLRDLRNRNVVQNVTRPSARRLWRYAITEFETHPVQPDKVTWHGALGLWKTSSRQGRKRYDLVQRDTDGKLHLYYGVTEDGIHGEWGQFVEKAQ
jgi:PHP family Zn ribbon phosphoesterase